MTNWTLGGLALTVAIVAVACGGSRSSPSAPTPATTTVTYSLLTAAVVPQVMPVGDSGSASVSGWKVINGTRIFGPVTVTAWSSSNTAVATITNAGAVKAVGPGTATLIATFEGGTHAVSVSVFGDREIEALDVTCQSPVPVQQTTTCQLQLHTLVGAACVNARWASSKPDIATVLNGSFTAGAAFVRGNAPGQTVITATCGAFQGSATVEVR